MTFFTKHTLFITWPSIFGIMKKLSSLSRFSREIIKCQSAVIAFCVDILIPYIFYRDYTCLRTVVTILRLYRVSQNIWNYFYVQIERIKLNRKILYHFTIFAIITQWAECLKSMHETTLRVLWKKHL